MLPLWLCWVLWLLPLAGPGAAVMEEQVLGRLLQQLQLSQAPTLDRVDVEGVAIPNHVRAQYVALLHRSHADRSRGKRFSQNFREVAGRFLVSETSTHLLVFGMEQRLPPNSELVQAVLRLFQEPVPRTALRRHERLSPYSARARVTIEWLRVREDGSNRTALIDSRLVSVHESGWKAFDVTEAVNFWQQLSRPRQPLLLQVWPFLGPRQCIASEMTSLPMIVSIKEGGRTRPQVVSLPNMRVQKCSCASDGALIPRGIDL
nr:left-right determination factor 2 [Meriones unguiculatus]